MKPLFFLYVLANIKLIISELGQTNNEDFECGLDEPLYDITTNSCVISSFDESKHKISNNIIKKQWQNRINQIGIQENWYMGYDISSKGDLIIQSSRYYLGQVIKERYFYGIKSNGRELFYDEGENKFINQKIIISNSNYKKFETEFIKIKLINDDENDYYLSTTTMNNSIEINDLNANKIEGVYQELLLGENILSSIRYSIFELINDPKTYMFGLIVKCNSSYYLSLQKFQFNKTDLNQENSFQKLGFSLLTENFKIYNSKIISCIEISKYQVIQCFYLDTDKYLSVGLFNEDNLNYIYSERVFENYTVDNSNLPEYNGFYKCILLKNEISILSYILKNEEGKFNLFIEIKKLTYNSNHNTYNFEDYLVKYKQIMINKDIVISDSYFYSFDIIKNNNYKFSVAYYANGLNKIILVIAQLYKIHDTNLYIKYYSINLKLYGFSIFRYVKNLIYNDYLGLIYTSEYKSDNGKKYQYFSIFSYINSTDSELNTNINNGFKLNISEYINKENIENNIFGVELIRIKILQLPKSNETGIYFISSKLNNQLVYENGFLHIDDEIIFIFDYDLINPGGTYKIELAGIVQEQNYLEDKNFTIFSEYYGSESFENYYQQHIYIGRTSFYNFSLPSGISRSNDGSCAENCKVCYSGKCIKCKDNYKLILDQNICKIDFNEEGYYYDEDNFIYKKCHEFCKTCDKGPKYYEDLLEVEDTNCNECIEGYYKMENTDNCVNIDNPPMFHYFNETEEKFLKCSENCLTCNQSQVNSTYYGCTSCDENSILYPESTNCLNCFARNKYINPYFN